MKRLLVSLVIGVFIGLVALCVTTEVMGFVYVNNNLTEYVVTELFTELELKLIFSVSAGLFIGIVLYVADSDINEWRKVIAYISSLAMVIVYMFIMNKIGVSTAKAIDGIVYFTISMLGIATYMTITREILKRDIKQINEKLKK